MIYVLLQVHKDKWYYTALEYNSPDLNLYLTPDGEYESCFTASPASTCSPAATAEQTGQWKIYYHLQIKRGNSHFMYDVVINTS